MSTPVKLHGFKLGQLEKNVIYLMRKGDEPHGKPILIWMDICQTYGIEFSAYPKKDQPEEFFKEKQYKCALSRLVKARIIKPSIRIPSTSENNFSIPNPKGHGYNYYSLTKFGRAVADKLHQEQHQKERSMRAKVDLKKVMDKICDTGCVEFAIDLIQRELWQLSGDSFGSRAEFDGYWSNTKIGIMLKGYRVEPITRVGKKDRHQKYRWIQ